MILLRMPGVRYAEIFLFQEGSAAVLQPSDVAGWLDLSSQDPRAHLEGGRLVTTAQVRQGVWFKVENLVFETLPG